MTNPESFTRVAYRDLLKSLLNLGYSGCTFPDAIPDQRNLLLRHDIDLWPSAALDIARIENELGLSADYFFLMKSPLYNPASPETMDVFQGLLSLGHRIGLHFDTSLYAPDWETIDRSAAIECAALETLIGVPVTLVSFHRPAKALLGLPDPVAGRDHVYQPRFFEQIGYCSDSRGIWRHGHPLSHSVVEQGTALQLLTHPIWWATDCQGDREAALACMLDAKDKEMKAATAQTVSGYSTESGKIIDVEQTGS
jgi:hypothetical protein